MKALRAQKARLMTSFALLAAVTLSACSSAAVGGGDEADSVSLDSSATKEEFQEALSNMEPVTLVAQPLSSSSESWSASAYEEYAAQIEEWSGGNIQMELNYGYPIADISTVGSAVADGRLDYGVDLPIYSPNDFPIGSTALVEAASFLPNDPIIGEMTKMGAMQQIAWETEAIMSEFDENVVVVQPAEIVQGPVSLVCTEPVTESSDLGGKVVGVSAGPRTLDQIEALGGTPTSISITESYEALQRGVIDCVVTTFSNIAPIGHLAIAPYVTIFEESSFSPGTEAFFFNKQQWDSLPLAGRQLLFDKKSDFQAARVQDLIEVVYPSIVTQLEESNGEILQPSEELEDRLADFNNGMMKEWEQVDQLDPGFGEYVQEVIANWNDQLAEAGYPSGGSFSDLTDSGPEELDMSAFQELLQNMRDDYRPTSTSG